MKKIIFILSIFIINILIAATVFAGIIPIPSDSTSTTISTPSALQSTSLNITNPLGETSDISTLVSNILNFLIKLAIPITAILVVYAGFLYITSAGNEEKVKTAQKALIWAIVGFAVVLIASSVPAIIQEFLSGESNTTAPIIDQEPESSFGPGLPSLP